MDKEIFDELNLIADGFWHNKKMLNRDEIQRDRHLRITKFGSDFDDALNDFLRIRKFDAENHNPEFDSLLGHDPVKDFYAKIDAFLDVVTVAKTHDLIIDKEIPKELDHYKSKVENNDKLLKIKDDMITQLKNKNKELQTKIDTAIERYPTLQAILYENESEVREDV